MCPSCQYALHRIGSEAITASRAIVPERFGRRRVVPGPRRDHKPYVCGSPEWPQPRFTLKLSIRRSRRVPR